MIGPSTSRDLVIRGTVVDPNDPSVVYTGDLITGSVATIGFGFLSQDANTAVFDFRFTITGGSMANYPGFARMDMGGVITSENSDFDGTFTRNFSGLITGGIGPIAPTGSDTQPPGLHVSPANSTILTPASLSGGSLGGTLTITGTAAEPSRPPSRKLELLP